MNQVEIKQAEILATAEKKRLRESWDYFLASTKSYWKIILGVPVLFTAINFFSHAWTVNNAGWFSALSIVSFISAFFIPWRFKLSAIVLSFYVAFLTSLPTFENSKEIEAKQANELKLAQEQEVKEKKLADENARKEAEDAAAAETAQKEAIKTEQEKKEREYAEQCKGIIYPGDTCITTTITLAADSMDDLKEAKNCLLVRDREGMEQMITEGKIIMLGENAKVLVLDDKSDWATIYEKVRVMSGDCAHQVVWTAKDSLKPVARGAVYKCGLHD